MIDEGYPTLPPPFRHATCFRLCPMCTLQAFHTSRLIRLPVRLGHPLPCVTPHVPAAEGRRVVRFMGLLSRGIRRVSGGRNKSFPPRGCRRWHFRRVALGCRARVGRMYRPLPLRGLLLRTSGVPHNHRMFHTKKLLLTSRPACPKMGPAHEGRQAQGAEGIVLFLDQVVRVAPENLEVFDNKIPAYMSPAAI